MTQETVTPETMPFVLRYGVAAIGVPLAIIADLVFLTLGDNWPMFLSWQHMEQLAVMLICIPPTFGTAIGYGLLQLTHRRSRAAELERAFRE